MKYKILIFDLDDTLIDNKENVKHAFGKMMEFKHIKYSETDFCKWYEIDKNFWKDWQDGLINLPEEYKKETGKKSEDFLNWVRAQRVLIFFDNCISLNEAIVLNKIYMEALTEIVIPITNAFETLKYLSTKYKVLIATNGPQIATNEKLKKINCLQFVDKILSADMFGYMKPKIEFFDAIQQILNNHNNQEYLIIGDSLKSDVGFGMNCNINSCWFDRKTEELTNQYNPTFIIRDLIELIKIL